MTLEQLNQMIDKAIKDAQERPQAMKQTNVLNAEYALGKIFAILDIIQNTHGIDALIEAKERIDNSITELTDRTQAIYTR